MLEEENPKSSPNFSSKSDARGPNFTTKSIVKLAENSRNLISSCSRVPWKKSTLIRIETFDKIAGAVVADRDKTARAGAIHDKIAEEVVEFLAEQPIEATLNTVDPFIELIVLAADRVEETDEDTIEKIAEEASDDNTINLSIELVIQAADRVSEEAVEIIVIDPVTETIIDKIAEEAADDNTIDPSIELAVDRVGEEADENIVEKFVINSSIEATVDNTIDPYIELAVLAAELAVDTSIEAILVAEERIDENFVDTSIEAILVAEERGDEFSVDPLIEAIQSRETTDKEAEGPRFKSSQSALRHTIVYRLSEFDEFGRRI